ncbi:MAG TPA: alpha/beta hydrolase [Gemmatimonadaceae bacterium]|nr:alpha/beta hydrolase [Gemmatimonadaceae bacterium]
MSIPRRIQLAAFASAVIAAQVHAQRVPSRLPRDDGWVDSTKHRAGFVTVQRGVRLHYLDFGGTGPAILLLPGIGNTAHAYDDFAPALTDRFRVYALTRRGFGESSHPQRGYDLPRLVDDIRAAMDSLRLRQVDLVGHSFAGQEMTRFAREYPGRVRRLVYLDGAFDNVTVDSIAATVFTAAMPYPVKAPLAVTDTGTYRGYVSYVRATRGVKIPESDIRVRVRHDGIIEELGTGYTGIGREMESERQRWEKLHQPALGIFAVRERFDQSEPWIVADRSWRDDVQAVIDKSKVVTELAIADFKRAPRAEALAISGGHHWIFVSHRDIVLAAVREFLLRK